MVLALLSLVQVTDSGSVMVLLDEKWAHVLVLVSVVLLEEK